MVMEDPFEENPDEHHQLEEIPNDHHQLEENPSERNQLDDGDVNWDVWDEWEEYYYDRKIIKEGLTIEKSKIDIIATIVFLIMLIVISSIFSAFSH